MEAQFDVKSEPSQQIPFWPQDDVRQSMQTTSPLGFGPSSPASSTSSSIGSIYSGSVTPSFGQDAAHRQQLSDEELAQLTVRELNQRLQVSQSLSHIRVQCANLQGQDRKMVSALKQKRRTLKNRGYAFNCRVRRLQLQLQLEAENVMLKNEMRYLRQMLHESQSRLSYYEGQPPAVPSAHFQQQNAEQPKYDSYSTLYQPNGQHGQQGQHGQHGQHGQQQQQQFYSPVSPPIIDNPSNV